MGFFDRFSTDIGIELDDVFARRCAYGHQRKECNKEQ